MRALWPPNSSRPGHLSTQSSAHLPPSPTARRRGGRGLQHSATRMKGASGRTASLAFSIAFWAWKRLMSLGPAQATTISAGLTALWYISSTTLAPARWVRSRRRRRPDDLLIAIQNDVGEVEAAIFAASPCPAGRGPSRRPDFALGSDIMAWFLLIDLSELTPGREGLRAAAVAGVVVVLDIPRPDLDVGCRHLLQDLDRSTPARLAKVDASILVVLDGGEAGGALQGGGPSPGRSSSSGSPGRRRPRISDTPTSSSLRTRAAGSLESARGALYIAHHDGGGLESGEIPDGRAEGLVSSRSPPSSRGSGPLLGRTTSKTLASVHREADPAGAVPESIQASRPWPGW